MEIESRIEALVLTLVVLKFCVKHKFAMSFKSLVETLSLNTASVKSLCNNVFYSEF